VRVERRGKVEALTPRLIEFMVTALGGQCVDDLLSPENRRIDYVCLRGLLAVEVKTLELDASERMDNLTQELRERPDWPEFYGAWPIESVLSNLDEPEQVRRRVVNRIGRSVVNHLKKADKQLLAHTQWARRKNLVRVLLLVNEDHAEYDPHTVQQVLLQELHTRRRESASAYEAVDAILYVSERHATVVDGQVTLPIISVEGPSMGETIWKRAIFERFAERWAAWTTGKPLRMGDVQDKFEPVEHVPEKESRQSQWQRNYRRAPYLRPLSIEQLRERWDEATVLSIFKFHKRSPLRASIGDAAALMEQFAHLLEELAHRGIPLAKFRYESGRHPAAARRLKVPPEALAWIEQLEREA
jgi:hypothetical protein